MTTPSGLAIAIPLMILVANVNIRIAKMEDLVGAGLARFMAAFRDGLAKVTIRRSRPSAGQTVDPMAMSVSRRVTMSDNRCETVGAETPDEQVIERNER